MFQSERQTHAHTHRVRERETCSALKTEIEFPHKYKETNKYTISCQMQIIVERYREQGTMAVMILLKFLPYDTFKKIIGVWITLVTNHLLFSCMYNASH